MPLLPPILAAELIKIDDPSPPKDIPTTAKRWTDAWVNYASMSTYLNPPTLIASRQLMSAAFMAVILPGCVPNPVPMTFFLALEGAMRAGWASVSSPASLMPPALSIVPAPAPFAPLALAIVPVGIVSPTPAVPRTMLATIIHTWTMTHLVLGPAGPITPLGPLS